MYPLGQCAPPVRTDTLDSVAGHRILRPAAPEVVKVIFTAFLLLSPLPLLGNVDLPVSNPTAVVAEVPNISSPLATSKELTAPHTSTPVTLSEVSATSMPQPKANSDADPSFADPAVPEPRPFAFQPIKQATRHRYTDRNEKIAWYSLMIAAHAGAVLDAWSTRRALSGNYGREADPLMRPFAHSGTLYLATQVTPLLMDVIGRRAMMSERPWVRKLWWVPQSVDASLSFQAGIHNIGVVH
jgi:hypothetical protein